MAKSLGSCKSFRPLTSCRVCVITDCAKSCVQVVIRRPAGSCARAAHRAPPLRLLLRAALPRGGLAPPEAGAPAAVVAVVVRVGQHAVPERRQAVAKVAEVAEVAAEAAGAGVAAAAPAAAAAALREGAAKADREDTAAAGVDEEEGVGVAHAAEEARAGPAGAARGRGGVRGRAARRPAAARRAGTLRRRPAAPCPVRARPGGRGLCVSHTPAPHPVALRVARVLGWRRTRARLLRRLYRSTEGWHPARAFM